MKTNPLLALEASRQSIWTDDICRGTIKVLDTPERIPAIHPPSVEGINLNFTLLFDPLGYWKVTDADQVLEHIPYVGMDPDATTDQLEDEGVAKFSEAFEQLMAALHEEWAVLFPAPTNP